MLDRMTAIAEYPDATLNKGLFGVNSVYILPRGIVMTADKHHAAPMTKVRPVKTDKKEVLKYPVAVS